MTATSAGLRVRALSKTFGTVPVLQLLDLDVAPGTIHALVGGNGSGKSTTIKILSGYQEPDKGGMVEIAGKPLKFGSAEAAYGLGARFVQQDLGLIASATVLDNMCLVQGFPSRFGTIRTREAERQIHADLDRLGIDVDVRTLVSALSPAMRTNVAIARALREDPTSPTRLLVLDEPTATLPDSDVQRLTSLVREVANRGIAILYVSHRLEEVLTLCDDVTVLRDGRRIGTRRAAGLDRSALVALLVGETVEECSLAPTNESGTTTPALEVSGLKAENVRDMSFAVRPGEVVGLAGITGSGREHVLSAIFGGTPRFGGRVTVDGSELPVSRPDRSMALGLAYLPPDRKALGGIMDLSARENLTVAYLKPFWSRGRLRRDRESAEVRRLMGSLDVRPQDPDLAFKSFSGGNQQKILFGKWLRRSPRVLLLDEPTQGVDVRAKRQLHESIAGAAQTGAAVVVASSDADELATVCARVLIMQDGRVSATLSKDRVSATAISRACVDSVRGSRSDSAPTAVAKQHGDVIE